MNASKVAFFFPSLLLLSLYSKYFLIKIFTTENPNVNETIVLQDGDHGVTGTPSKVQYTIIEDGSGGGYLQPIGSSGQHGKKYNV